MHRLLPVILAMCIGVNSCRSSSRHETLLSSTLASELSPEGALGDRLLPSFLATKDANNDFSMRLQESRNGVALQRRTPQFKDWINQLAHLLGNRYRLAHQDLLISLKDHEVEFELLELAVSSPQNILMEMQKLEQILSLNLPSLVASIENFSSLINTLNDRQFSERRVHVMSELEILLADSVSTVETIHTWLRIALPSVNNARSPCGHLAYQEYCTIGEAFPSVWHVGPAMPYELAINYCAQMNETLNLRQQGVWQLASQTKGLEDLLTALASTDDSKRSLRQISEAGGAWLNREVDLTELPSGANDHSHYVWAITLQEGGGYTLTPELARLSEAALTSDEHEALGKQSRKPAILATVCQRMILSPRQIIPIRY